jgi:CDP-diacylglycerol--glycerol-3-phosphate 3-phosphatidyltransferase
MPVVVRPEGCKELITVFDGRFRSGVDSVTAPIGRSLAKAHISADALTISGVALSGVAALAIVTGHFFLAFVFVVLTGLPDLLDGPVAKASGTTSRRGAFFDSVADRVSDLTLFGSLAWFYLDRGDHALALVSFGTYGAASLVSYQRSKAELLGFEAKGGLLERAERVFLFGAGLLLSFALPYVMVFLLVGSVVTAVQRFLKVWKQGSASDSQPVKGTYRGRHISKTRGRRIAQRRRTTERVRSTLSSSRVGRSRGGLATQSLMRKFREGAGS